MKQKDKHLTVSDGVIILVGVLIISLANVWHTKSIVIERVPEVVAAEIETTVAYGSDSMGLTFVSGDHIYGEKVSEETVLEPGKVYVYRSGNKTVIHRLVLCLDEQCDQTVFKGDNNLVAELVNRSDVLYRVVLKST